MVSNTLLYKKGQINYSNKQKGKYFPFVLQQIDRKYIISAKIESKDLYPKYYTFFKKLDYEGNGYCWEGHIKQILEKLDKPLLQHIVFDSEAGMFSATTDTNENQIKIASMLSPIFSNMKKLEEWVKRADRNKIDD